MHQKNIIKLATPKKIETIMTKIGLHDIVPSDSHIDRIIRNFDCGDITILEKNQLMISIISNQLTENSKYFYGFKTKNACPSCNGKGFNIILELELNDKCMGTHDVLPCNGSGIMTKTCIRCNSLTLNNILKIRHLIIEYKKGRITNIPSMDKDEDLKFRENFNHYSSIDIRKIHPAFISKNGEKTFRVIQTNRENKNISYSYIQKDPCKACSGSGRFVYTNPERTIKCPGCHGKGKVKAHLTSTNKIKFIAACNKCSGSGKTFSDNPVLNIKRVEPEIRKELENRGLLKKQINK